MTDRIFDDVVDALGTTRLHARIAALEAQVKAADGLARELAIIIQDWDGEQEDMIDAADALAAYNATVNAATYRAAKEASHA
jgi:hypothetical protein